MNVQKLKSIIKMLRLKGSIIFLEKYMQISSKLWLVLSTCILKVLKIANDSFIF